jgi:phosphoribosylaminoimidazole-succinocarboxamide synthase
LIEAVVRGYLAGSGWQEYRTGGAVCGVSLPPGLRQASRLPEPIFTPVQKAPFGQHDRNIDFTEMQALVGAALAEEIRTSSLALFVEASAHVKSRGVILADTKFEFGLDAQGALVLMDEVLTPDSSRFWPVESYAEGINPPGYDKQYLRDWLERPQADGRIWDKRPPAPLLPPEVIQRTAAVYQQAFERLAY